MSDERDPDFKRFLHEIEHTYWRLLGVVVALMLTCWLAYEALD